MTDMKSLLNLVCYLYDNIQTLFGHRPNGEILVAVRSQQRSDCVAEIVGEIGRRSKTWRCYLRRHQSTRLNLLLATQNALLWRRRWRSTQRRIRQRLDCFQKCNATHYDLFEFRFSIPNFNSIEDQQKRAVQISMVDLSSLCVVFFLCSSGGGELSSPMQIQWNNVCHRSQQQLNSRTCFST